jgi:hypothetical protein
MRGHDTQQAGLFSYLSPEERVPASHPLRQIRRDVEVALTAVSPQLAALVICPNGSALDCPGEAAPSPRAPATVPPAQ